jgi:predicted nucleotidyltransferase
MTVAAVQLALTRAGMKLIVFGSCDSGDNEFDSSLDIYQSIEQSKACSGLLHAVIQQVT